MPPPQDDVPQPDGISTTKGFTYAAQLQRRAIAPSVTVTAADMCARPSGLVGGTRHLLGCPSCAHAFPHSLQTGHLHRYQRLGIRIPTIAISPWIAKGTLVGAPSAQQKQQPSSEWSLSSILATAQAVLGLQGGPLTKRDAWSARFHGLLEALDEPRADCPLTLPDVPPPAAGELERQLGLPIDEHCEHVIRTLCELVHGPPAHSAPAAQPAGGLYCESLGICRNTSAGACGSGIETFGDFSAWRVGMWQQWMAQD